MSVQTYSECVLYLIEVLLNHELNTICILFINHKSEQVLLNLQVAEMLF